ncbi:MAG: hypothetical protein L3J46_10560 [Kangiellaceae bacterium]|nr:hypothetical protein [Kangiellaceae bacterium]
MTRYIGKRSENKVGVSIANLPDPMNMALWKALRKRLTIPEGQGEACIRNDPEFGLTPYTRRFGIVLNPKVEEQNKMFAKCARLIDAVFKNVKIKYKVETGVGSSTKYAKHTMIEIGGSKYFATRDAIRKAMSICRHEGIEDANTLLSKIQELVNKGDIKLYTENEIKEKYPNAEIIQLQS